MRTGARASLHVVDPTGSRPTSRVMCARCARAVETDVMPADQLLDALGWARIDGRVLCVSCRQDAGRPADLIRRILTRS